MMKEREMGVTWKVLVFAALAALSVAVPAQDLSESEVQAVLDRMEAANERRDVDTIGRFLSEGAQISGTLTVGTDVQPFRYSKQEYLQSLRDAWALLVDLRSQTSNQVIAVSGRVATVTYDARITMVVPAGEMHARSRDTLTLERLDGRVLVTRVVSHSSMEGVNAVAGAPPPGTSSNPRSPHHDRACDSLHPHGPTMTSFACSKCGGTEYSRNEMRAEGGFLSAAFDISTNRFTAVSCEGCGYTELYRTNAGTGAKIFDFLVS